MDTEMMLQNFESSTKEMYLFEETFHPHISGISRIPPWSDVSLSWVATHHPFERFLRKFHG